ncbi:hypothetical protein AAHH78_38200, partial [Burkholderia pseudomallei]
RDPHHACAQLGANCRLAGAPARDNLMGQRHANSAPDATRDGDVAVCAVSWAAPDALSELVVVSQRCWRHPNLPQKLRFTR